MFLIHDTRKNILFLNQINFCSKFDLRPAILFAVQFTGYAVALTKKLLSISSDGPIKFDLG